MKHLVVFAQAILTLIAIPTLACGPAALQVTPTPTKTPKIIQLPAEVPTATLAAPALPTATLPPPPTETPALPPTDTPTPEPPPTDTPVPPTDTPPPPPPPPPTHTPPPPPPPTEPPPPAEPEPAQPPPGSKPAIVIDWLNGDRFSIGDEVRIRITVSDPDGVNSFEWGVFTENRTSVQGGDRGCGNATHCELEEEFEAKLPGAFQIGVEAKDSTGEGAIEVRQIYVG